MGMGKELLLCLKRHKNNWRMDHETLSRFMSFAEVHFKIGDLMHSLDFDEVMYGELTPEDLRAACSVFGCYAPSEDTVYLVPVYSCMFITPWQKQFVLKLYKNEEEYCDQIVKPARYVV